MGYRKIGNPSLIFNLQLQLGTLVLSALLLPSIITVNDVSGREHVHAN